MAAFLCALSSDIYKKTKVIGYWTYITYSRNNSRFEQLSHREKWGKKTWPTEKSMLHYAKPKKTPILAAQGVEYPGFQVTGMIEGFLGALKFRFREFLGRKIWLVFFGWLDLSRDFSGYSKQCEGSR